MNDQSIDRGREKYIVIERARMIERIRNIHIVFLHTKRRHKPCLLVVIRNTVRHYIVAHNTDLSMHIKPIERIHFLLIIGRIYGVV